MPLSHLNRRCYSHIVGIIPGPQEPKNLDPYLQPLLDEFKQFGPQGEKRYVGPWNCCEHVGAWYSCNACIGKPKTLVI